MAKSARRQKAIGAKRDRKARSMSGGGQPMPCDENALKQYLIGVLSLDFPYTNEELLTLAKSQGHKAKLTDIKTAVASIAADVRAGRLRRGEGGAWEATSGST